MSAAQANSRQNSSRQSSSRQNSSRIDRTQSSLLSSNNKLKLAVFGVNVSSGCTMTSAEGTIQVEWAESKRIAQAAEKMGIEGMVPVARWRGFGGDVDFNHRSFETYTWAAGLAAATEKISIFSASHVPTVHPVLAAKQGATIDHISDGRFVLNIVAGWNETEIAMFGAPQKLHDDRNAVAGEWITIMKRLWTEEDSFDFKGKYFSVPNAYSEPKPIQSPYPLIMSAGLSPAGRRFAAEHADFNFVVVSSLEAARASIAEIKDLAWQEFGREIRVFGMGYVVCRDTEQEAKSYEHYYVHEKGDWTGVRNLLNTFIPNSESMSPEESRALATNMIAGYGALPLVGTPQQVVEGMQAMSDVGMDGLTLCWVDYDEGLAQFEEQTLPLMIQAGLREEQA